MVTEQMTGMVSAAIIAHPSRKLYVRELRRKINVPIVWDQTNNMWDTARRAILSYDPAAEYHVIVDDDALPASNFLQGCEGIAKVLPQPTLVGLFVGEDLRLPALLNGHAGHGGEIPNRVSFLSLAGVLNWGVATMIPVAWIPNLVDYCDTLNFPEVDRRMGTFANALRYPTLYAWPSIVNHRVGPSLRNAKFTRVALNCAKDARQDWSGTTLSLPFDSRVPYTARELAELRRSRRVLASGKPSR